MLGANFARDRAEQTGLAGTVAPDQAGARAVGDLRRCALEQKPAGDADRKFVDHKHGRLSGWNSVRTQPHGLRRRGSGAILIATSIGDN